jgi:hypothetical protein
MDGTCVEMLWTRLTMHLREAGVRHYGRLDSQLDEDFCISQGTMFSDGCLLGLTVSVFDEWEDVDGNVIEREFTFDAPQRDFNYFGTAILSSSTPIGIMGDQSVVASLAERVDGGEDYASTRELADGEPSFSIVYAPEVYPGKPGVVNYCDEKGPVPRELGTYVVARQVDHTEMFKEHGQSIRPVMEHPVEEDIPDFLKAWYEKDDSELYDWRPGQVGVGTTRAF